MHSVHQAVRRYALGSHVARSRAFSGVPEIVLAAAETRTARLDNGVQVATESGAGPLASIGVFVGVGSRHESSAKNGTSALLEALAFSGKEKEIAALGGKFSSSVTREHVSYQATVLKEDVPAAWSLLADAAKGTNISAATVEKAKNALLSKHEGFKGHYEDNIMDHLHDAAFLDTAMGMSPLGTPDTILQLGEEDLRTFISQQYLGQRAVVAGAGAVEHQQLAELASSELSLAKAPDGGLDIPVEPGYFTGSDKRIRYDSVGKGYVALAFEGVPASSEYAVPLMLIQAILGTYDVSATLGDDASSRWCLDMSGFSLAQFATSFNTTYQDTGLFGIYAVCPDNKLDDFMWYTLDNLVRLVHKVSDEEVERAKGQLITTLALQTSTSSGISADIGKQILSLGRRVPLAELFARIQATSTADVKQAADKVINDKDHALAAVGTLFELPDYNWIRRRSYWLRY